MPFAPGEVPERLKGKGIPAKFIRMFNHTWNSVYEKTKSEQRAYKAAYSVMGKALEKAGYRKDKEGVWHKEEAMKEGWLPSSISQNDLDDGDFAWLSDAYRKASPKEKAEMNKGEHRKLPYKIHGTVNVRGWRAAWIAAANPGSARALKSYSGGPSREQVLAKLRRDKPKGITIDKDLSIHGGEEHEPYVLLESLQKISVQEVREDGMRVSGVALIDGAISGNDRYYSREFNDLCMERTNEYLKNNTAHMYTRHGSALGQLMSMPTALPIGKLTGPLYREGKEVWYNAFIADTSDGADVIKLIQSEVMLGTSIRAPWETVKTRKRKLEGREVDEMLEATIVGIDFAPDPGIKGAGIRAVLEEAPIWEEEDMNWEEVTLEDLRENCKGLLDEYAATLVGPAQEEAQVKVDELTSAVATLTEEKDAVVKTIGETEAKLAEAESKVKDLELKVKIAEAAHIGSISKTVYAGLMESVKSEEDIAKVLTEEKDKAMTLALAAVGTGEPKGKGRIEDNDDEKEDEPLTEGQEKVLSLAG